MEHRRSYIIRIDAQTVGGFWYVACDLCHMSMSGDAQSGRGTAATYSFSLHARSPSSSDSIHHVHVCGLSRPT